MNELPQYLENRRRRVESFLAARCNGSSKTGPAAPPLNEAIRYSLLAGGKRLRPILVIAAAEACWSSGGDAELAAETVLPVAAAIEMIHTYSLIHDDLPSMDNDDLRRGLPTSHRKFGEAVAILAGDALLTDAFGTIASIPSAGPAGGLVSASTLLEVVGDIARAAGGEGMAWGQALDLAYQGRRVTGEELELLHRRKTGSLIEVSVTSGAKLAGAAPVQLERIRTYGRAVGLAFQIVDDILDVEGASEKLGKGVGGDLRKEKATYPSVIGLAASKSRAASLVQDACEALNTLGERADRLKSIARWILERAN